MKKFWILLLLLIIVISTTGCSTSSSSNKPYYKTLDLYSGYYCVDAKGTTYGAPPGYYYDEQYYVQHEIWVGDQMELGPKKLITEHKINQSAWIKFADWPSCKIYGE